MANEVTELVQAGKTLAKANMNNNIPVQFRAIANHFVHYYRHKVQCGLKGYLRVIILKFMHKAKSQKYTCVILDDNPGSVEFISQQLSNIPNMDVLGQFIDPVEATTAFLKYDVVDFLFLDIGMEISGIEVARMLKNQIRFIIFVTGYSEFALEALEAGDAYLVKPVDLATLKRAITHLLQKQGKYAFITA